MGAYYTWTQGVGISVGQVFTFTHSLSFTPASMVARIFAHNATATATAPPQLLTLGTNVATFGINATLTTCDIEVQMPHSIIQ